MECRIHWMWLKVSLGLLAGRYVRTGRTPLSPNVVINHRANVDSSSVVEAVWKMDSIYCQSCLRGLWEATIHLLAILKRRSHCTGISFNHLPETGGKVRWHTILFFFFTASILLYLKVKFFLPRGATLLMCFIIIIIKSPKIYAAPCPLAPLLFGTLCSSLASSISPC